MIKANYTNEEKEFISKWGRDSDKLYDTTITCYSINGTKVSALDLAKTRAKSTLRKSDPELRKFIYDMRLQ